MDQALIKSYTFSFPYSIAFKDWMLYIFTIVQPLFMFSIVFSRDSVPFWVVIIMMLFSLFEFLRTGTVKVDQSFSYLLCFLFIYILTTLFIYFDALPHTWLGRTPLERAIAIDLRLVYVITCFIVFLNFLNDAPANVFLKIFKVQIFVGIVIAIFGILQYLSYSIFHSELLSRIEPTNDAFILRSNLFRFGRESVYRSSSIFNEPSYFGFFLVPLFVKTALAKAKGFILWSKGIHNLIIATLIVAILTNFSFTALSSLAVLAGFIVIGNAIKSPKFSLTILMIFLLLCLVLYLSPLNQVLLARIERIVEFRDASAIDRLVRVYTSTLVVLDNFWLGVGPGGYAFWYPRLGGLDTTTMASPLNVWLTFLTDVGVVGFLPFIFFLRNVLRRAFRNATLHPLISVYFWSVISYLVLLTTLDFWFLEMFWFELALLLSLSINPCIQHITQSSKRLLVV